jgi:DNA polymerase III epsilon subunit-like protein
MIFSLIDSETTNLTLHPDVDIRRQPRMVEFAGILTDGMKILDDVEFQVNPGRPIDPGASKVSGITDEMAAKCPIIGPFHTGRLRHHFERAQVVIAHNLSFDKMIIRAACYDMDCGLADIAWPMIEVCTVEETAPLFGKPMKLQTLYELKRGEYKQRHRARDDLNLLHAICLDYGVYDALLKRFAA